MQPENGFGDWKKLQDILRDFDERLHRNAGRALLEAGEVLASMARERVLDSRDMDPLHPMTPSIKRKHGGTKPLVDNGFLLGSIGVRQTDPLEVAVGVFRMAEDGTNVAEIHSRENGTTVRVTEKMRAFLHRRGFHLKPSTKTLFIPGRPFLKPAYEDFKQSKATERIVGRFVEATVEGKG